MTARLAVLAAVAVGALGAGMLAGAVQAATTRSNHGVPGAATSFDVSPDDNALPIPPIPPDAPPAYSAAPMPGEAAVPQDPGQEGTHIAPGLFNPRFYDEGNGYLAHSTMHSEQDRRIPATGLQLSMPLQ